MQGKGKGKGKGKASKSSETDKAVSETNNASNKTEIVKLKALDVFAGCGGMELSLCDVTNSVFPLTWKTHGILC